MASIFDGVGALVDEWLGIDDTWAGQPPRYRNRTNFLRLLNAQPNNLYGPELAKRLLDRIASNWQRAHDLAPHPPGQQNWRFRKKLKISPKNESAEKKLEKRIAFLTGDDWANQIPTSSGLVDAGGRHCNIDLAHRQGTAYSLIELKWRSNTPIYAAVEILSYGLVYLFSRLRRGQLGYDGNVVFDATAIHLQVLAPRAYYRGAEQGRLDWLSTAISDGVAHVTADHIGNNLTMDFGFQRFPDGFDDA